MLDSTLLAGLLGAGGTIAGTLIGYKLNNTKADINVYIDNRVIMYYMDKNYAIYLPLTITNEGSRSSTISDFRIYLKSPTGQEWELYWFSFAEDNSHKNEPWKDGRRANPILIHGNSGSQHYIKLVEPNSTSDGYSNVILPAGEYALQLEYYDRDKKPVSKQKYKFYMGTEASEKLAELRKDKEGLQTWYFALSRS